MFARLSMALSSSPFFFLPASFLSSLHRQSGVFKTQRPLLSFPATQTLREWGQTPAIYRWVDMRTGQDAQTKTVVQEIGEKMRKEVQMSGHAGVEFPAKSLISKRPHSIILSLVINMHSFSRWQGNSEYMHKLMVCGTPPASANTQAGFTHIQHQVQTISVMI